MGGNVVYMFGWYGHKVEKSFVADFMAEGNKDKIFCLKKEVTKICFYCSMATCLP
jgi:hypothetical protein